MFLFGSYARMKRCGNTVSIKRLDIFDFDGFVIWFKTCHCDRKSGQHTLKQIVLNDIHFAVRHHRVTHIGQHHDLLILSQ